MKRLFLLVIMVIIFVYCVPVCFQYYQNQDKNPEIIHTVQNVENILYSEGSDGQNAKEAVESTKTQEETQEKTQDDEVMIAVSVQGNIRQMRLEEYAAGTTAAEIPAAFPEEALKAQAVAARTFVLYKQSLGKDEKHPDAVVCDDYTHCAAFVDLDTEAEKLWGKKAEEWKKKVQDAVRQTKGEIITYQGKPIAAVFHSAADKQTEAAVDVWGSDIPYLQTVSSIGDEDCPKYDASVTFGAEEFRQIMLRAYPNINLTGLPKTWFTDIAQTEAGGVITCKAGGQEMKGTEVRKLFKLNSTHFSISTTDTSITFHTQGYGHGVGMSQYGAKGMAEQGSGYRDILSHYYTGTQLTNIENIAK